jgi:heme-degrading monooxygenase HmoA
MHARVTTVVFVDYEPEIAEELFSAILPAVQPLHGFEGMTFLAGEANTLVVETFWESEEASCRRLLVARPDLRLRGGQPRGCR